MINSLVTGVHSEAFYAQFEALSDAVIDFKSTETAGKMEHSVRVRALRGKPYDSRLRPVKVQDTGEVTLSD
jgi:KaiC/GvpD/RAD55 family RecA-like ATPase